MTAIVTHTQPRLPCFNPSLSYVKVRLDVLLPPGLPQLKLESQFWACQAANNTV